MKMETRHGTEEVKRISHNSAVPPPSFYKHESGRRRTACERPVFAWLSVLKSCNSAHEESDRRTACEGPVFAWFTVLKSYNSSTRQFLRTELFSDILTY
ncbi:hypothetical protein E2C01_096586 [Portunus trituberculatus]|uniref:Uncharacterized protein n=1 Tax=Portunus trituberculatus TaxID=210409 RepID=A0A5B7K367_PORTR|nr:hypothetical protein [Portunus trituberculatus]